MTYKVDLMTYKVDLEGKDGFHQVGKGSDQKHIPSRDNIINKCRELENYHIPEM